ncbi:MAG: undecaprenyl-diphosphate phosphatase [Actinomycetota bacterium]|nr:undecaprenyl-diphosphate phosphatase [Actinomycetota bacterium]
MSLLQAIVLGIAQGLTEFLPISSSAHLRIIPAFAGWEDPGAAFTAVVQLGTMAAELLFFRHDLRRIAAAWLRALRRPELRGTLDARLGWYLVLGTIPISVVGLVLEDDIETTFRSLALIGTTLILLALVLLAADVTGRRHRGIADLTLRDGVIMGAAQTLALVPGVSRSGATMSAGLFLGLERAAAARFSFLLSIPAVVLSGLYQLTAIVGGEEAAGVGPGALVLATVLAFASGYAAIALLLRYLVTHSFAVFIGYRMVLGLVVLGLVALGVIA